MSRIGNIDSAYAVDVHRYRSIDDPLRGNGEPAKVVARHHSLAIPDPDANEPSSAGFTAQQGGLAVVGVILVGLGLWLNVTTSGSVTGKPVTRPAVELVARKLETSAEVLISLDRNGQPDMARFDLHKFLDQRIYHHMTEVNHQDYRAAHLAVDSSSQAAGSHAFTVKASGGVRYCLTVRTTGAPVLAGKPTYK